MDPVTHAVSGAVAMLALPKRPGTRWAVPLAALAAASPDIDVAFAFGPLQFLQLHRGITHSLFAMPLTGLLLALCARPLWSAATPGRFSFAHVWLLMCSMVLLHIWLDVVTTYGTMIFLPFSHYRVRLNGLFIVDILFTLPLIAVLWRGRTRRTLVLAALAWVFAYPGLCVALNARHSAAVEERLVAEGHKPESVTVLPDALSPFYWRVLFGEKTSVYDQPLNALGQPRGPANAHPALPPAAAAAFARQSVVCGEFFAFAMLPVLADLPAADFSEDKAENTAVHGSNGQRDTIRTLVYDLRFGTGHDFVRRIMQIQPNGDRPFQLLLEFAPETDAPLSMSALSGNVKIVRERLRFSGGGSKDSGWQPPVAPTQPGLLRRLVGLR